MTGGGAKLPWNREAHCIISLHMNILQAIIKVDIKIKQGRRRLGPIVVVSSFEMVYE